MTHGMKRSGAVVTVAFAALIGGDAAAADAVTLYAAGSLKVLDGKALKLTGGPDSAKPPEGRNPYAWVMEQRQADLFLTYCTNARLAAAEVPALRVVAVPAELAVGAAYGLTVVKAADESRGAAFADYILSPAGQSVLERYGFARP